LAKAKKKTTALAVSERQSISERVTEAIKDGSPLRDLLRMFNDSFVLYPFLFELFGMEKGKGEDQRVSINLGGAKTYLDDWMYKQWQHAVGRYEERDAEIRAKKKEAQELFEKASKEASLVTGLEAERSRLRTSNKGKNTQIRNLKAEVKEWKAAQASSERALRKMEAHADEWETEAGRQEARANEAFALMELLRRRIEPIEEEGDRFSDVGKD
jgi:hypothetical protein